jgi:hypothetical protein
MIKTLTVVGLAVFLVGCATSPIPAEKAARVPSERVFKFQSKSASESGSILVTRDTGFMGAGCFLGLYIDGVLAAKFDPGESASFFVPVGERLVGVGGASGAGLCALGDGKMRETTAVFRGGEVKRYRIVVRPGDGAALEPTSY